jgi:hypothetical protein
MDVFGRGGKLVAVLNIKDRWCSTCKSGQPWEWAEWSCVYDGEGIEIPGQVVGSGDGGNLLVEFPLRENLPAGQTSLVSFQATLEGNVAQYISVPFCALEGSTLGSSPGSWWRPGKKKTASDSGQQHKYHLVACTEMQGGFKYQLPEWLEYHMLQVSIHCTIHLLSMCAVLWLCCLCCVLPVSFNTAYAQSKHVLLVCSFNLAFQSPHFCHFPVFRASHTDVLVEIS